MPLLEATASAETACISTAAHFEDGKRFGHVDARAMGWWSRAAPVASLPPGSATVQTLLWAGWLAALLAGGLVDSGRIEVFALYSFACVLAVSWLPDDGSTVMPYYIHLFVAVLCIKSIQAGGVASFLPIGFIFIAIPIADWFVGVDLTNQAKAEQTQLQRDARFKWMTLSVVPVQLGVIMFGCWWASMRELSLVEFWGCASAVGIYTGAIGITVGHELCHKVSRLERACGRFLLCSVGYGHFYVEHTLGHHKLVATDEDPATARYGENFYSFLPRVIAGEFMSAVHIEAERTRKKGLPFWQNEIPMYFGLTLVLYLALTTAFGPKAAGIFWCQSLVAILLFESVNYLEHYGLERRRDVKTGAYEQVQPQHSWDSPAKLTNIILIKLQRHADHHANAGKRYQTLQAYDSSPQLPSGYATMILLALVPPLWRWVMDPRLMKFRATQKGQQWRHGPTPKAKTLRTLQNRDGQH